MTRVVAFGAFDLMHPGHVFYLEEASRLGDELIVIVARDSSIKKIKGKKPVQEQEQRLHNVLHTTGVNKAILGSRFDPYELIEEIRPDIIALGYDQKVYTNNLEKQLSERGINAEVVRIQSFHPEHYKSSTLRKRLLHSKD